MGIELRLPGRSRDLGGGLSVRRYLPDPRRQAVGPFVFFDHFGPVTRGPADNFDVRPHPHVGLATVTYLFEGALEHRDSLGSVQRIEPGAINWMSAGRGIVHSERSPPELRGQPQPLHGLQLWVALPLAAEDSAPFFRHYAERELPLVELDGLYLRVLVGRAFDRESPVRCLSPTLYLDVRASAGSVLELPASTLQLALYGIDRDLRVDDLPLGAGELAVLRQHQPIRISAPRGARYLVLGGEALEGPRLIWWNFVASSRERIDAAKEAWRTQRFDKVPGDAEFIPLPP